MTENVENAPWTQLGTSAAMATSLCVMKGNSRNAVFIKGTRRQNSHFFPRPEVPNLQGLNLTTALELLLQGHVHVGTGRRHCPEPQSKRVLGGNFCCSQVTISSRSAVTGLCGGWGCSVFDLLGSKKMATSKPFHFSGENCGVETSPLLHRTLMKKSEISERESHLFFTVG